MIYEDIAAAVAVALFIWLVPVRRNGIPGLRGRGKIPSGPPPPPPERAQRAPAPQAPLAKVLSLSGRRQEQLDREADQPRRGAVHASADAPGSADAYAGTDPRLAPRRPDTGRLATVGRATAWPARRARRPR